MKCFERTIENYSIINVVCCVDSVEINRSIKGWYTALPEISGKMSHAFGLFNSGFSRWRRNIYRDYIWRIYTKVKIVVLMKFADSNSNMFIRKWARYLRSHYRFCCPFVKINLDLWKIDEIRAFSFRNSQSQRKFPQDAQYM